MCRQQTSTTRDVWRRSPAGKHRLKPQRDLITTAQTAQTEIPITPKADKDEEKLAHTRCWVGVQNGTAALGNSWPDSFKTESGLPTICTPGDLFQRKEDLFSHGNLYTDVHGSFICNNPKLETTQMSFKTWTVKQEFQITEYYSAVKRKKSGNPANVPVNCWMGKQNVVRSVQWGIIC